MARWGTWREMYLRVVKSSGKEFSFAAFRHWFRGELLAPVEVIDCICRVSDSKASRPYQSVMSEVWGQRKGGVVRNRLYGSNLTRETRRLGGLRGRKALLEKYGENFSKHWKDISSKGGLRTLTTKKNLMRKTLGPKGELMFNDLEADTANALFAAGTKYRYEPQIRAGNRLLVPDFIVGDLVIECTRWVNAKEKSTTLRAKFEMISQDHPSYKFLVVTVPSFKNRYAQGMGEIRVTTVEGLKSEFREIPNISGEQN